MTLRFKTSGLPELTLPKELIFTAVRPRAQAALLRGLKPLQTRQETLWHVDELTSNGGGQVVYVIVVPGGKECNLVEQIDRIFALKTEQSVLGFGNSDCLSCGAHLLRKVPDGKAS